MAAKEDVEEEEIDPLANPGQTSSETSSRLASKRPSSTTSSSLQQIPSFQPSVASEPLDERSKLGQFGWAGVAGICLPTIFRMKNQNLVSVRMVERSLLSKFLHSLPMEVLSCPNVHSYMVTDVEARLLNEINTRHTDCMFGKENFTTKDLLVKQDDAEQFYKFLDISHMKMILKKSSDKDRCGFLRIGGTSDVPYVVVEGTKFLPLFYFEGEIDLKKCVTLAGWDWAYLKFCCKVQGVKDELIASDNCETVAFKDLRDYFPSGTSFVEYWPAKDFISRVVSKKNTQSGSWTKVIINPGGKKFEGKLTLIKEFPLQQNSNQAPYRAQKALINSKAIKCINIRPYQFMEVMITLPHMVEQLFPNFTEDQVGDMLVSLGVVLYKGNSGQAELIKKEGWEDKYRDVPLVTVKDILSNLQNMKSLVNVGEIGGKRMKGT